MKYGYTEAGALVAVLQDTQELLALRLTKSGVVSRWTANEEAEQAKADALAAEAEAERVKAAEQAKADALAAEAEAERVKAAEQANADALAAEAEKKSVSPKSKKSAGKSGE
jgi:hypothetical protein